MRDCWDCRRPQRFSFWTKGELARLAMIGAVCWYPLSMARDETAFFDRHPRSRVAPVASAGGSVRAIRVTPFDLRTTGAAALGDTDD